MRGRFAPARVWNAVWTRVRWQPLLRAHRTNVRVNRRVARAPVDALVDLPVRVETLDLQRDDLGRLLRDDLIARFRMPSGFHYKPIEYLTSLAVLDLADGTVILDAAGGPTAEFLRVAHTFTGRR